MKSLSSVSAQKSPFENKNLVEIFDAFFCKFLFIKNVVTLWPFVEVNILALLNLINPTKL